MQFDETQINKFWGKVWRRGVKDCWPWLGYTDAEGRPVFYLRIRGKAKAFTASRVAAEISGIPLEHRRIRRVKECTDKTCCNPAHILPAPEVSSIASPDDGGYNGKQRNTFPLIDGDDFLASLVPLRNGQSVSLYMDDPRFTSIKNYKGTKAKKLIVLVPGTLIGESNIYILVSVIGSGSCILIPKRKHKVADLVLAGMPAKLANILMDKLHRLFQE